MRCGWRLKTTETVVLFIYVYHSPPTNVGDLFQEVLRPHTGHHPMICEL